MNAKRAAPVAALVLVRACAAGAGAEGVGRQAGERRGWAARVLPPREDEQRRAQRPLRAGDGARGGHRVLKDMAPDDRRRDGGIPVRKASQARSAYSRPVRRRASRGHAAPTTRRTVPERERITIESVSAPAGVYCTPRSSAPVVTPVAATNTSSPVTRSSVWRTRSGSRPASTSALPLLVVARPEPALDAAADALQRCCRDHALRRAADPVEHVDARPGLRGGDRRCDVAVADQAHARARLAQLGDQLVVAVALEHDHVHLARRLPERLATLCTFSVGLRVMSIASIARGPTAIFSM